MSEVVIFIFSWIMKIIYMFNLSIIHSLLSRKKKSAGYKLFQGIIKMFSSILFFLIKLFIMTQKSTLLLGELAHHSYVCIK